MSNLSDDSLLGDASKRISLFDEMQEIQETITEPPKFPYLKKGSGEKRAEEQSTAKL